jgi:uncharacterized protein YecE (DUF72 family)
MQFLVGTSGYSYPEWKGSFYPEKMPQKEMLSYYARHFGAVEINNTFYKMPSASDIQSWAQQVPQGFQFAFKAHQAITHFKRLISAEQPMEQLFRITAPLKTRRGPVLFGLRDNFKKDVPRLKAFLRLIPKKAQAAFEFRHASWFDEDVYDCLRAKGCALCIADAPDQPRAPLIGTADFGYVRLRRERYSKKSLGEWIEKLRSLGWKTAYVFFKHEEAGAGPKLASRFLECVDKGN